MRGWAAFYDQTFLNYDEFCKINCAGQNKYTNIRQFSKIFCHKTRVFRPQKVQKNTVLSTMATQYLFNKSYTFTVY